MKQGIIGVLLVGLIFSISGGVAASDLQTKGSVTGLAGDSWLVEGDYQFSDGLKLTGDYDEAAERFRSGIEYDLSDRWGVKAGARYDSDLEDWGFYGGIDFVIPFGNNLGLTGFYDSNYEGEDWDRYEAAVRIEMYPGHFIYAGVMGNTGDGVPIYDYNLDNEGMLFIRGDFDWSFGRWGIEIEPVLLVVGEFFHDYSFTYQCTDQLDLVLNVESLHDNETEFRLGARYQF